MSWPGGEGWVGGGVAKNYPSDAGTASAQDDVKVLANTVSFQMARKGYYASWHSQVTARRVLKALDRVVYEWVC